MSHAGKQLIVGLGGVVCPGCGDRYTSDGKFIYYELDQDWCQLCGITIARLAKQMGRRLLKRPRGGDGFSDAPEGVSAVAFYKLGGNT